MNYYLHFYQDVFYRFKAILYTFQPFHQSFQFGVGIISVTLHFLFHRPIGIGHSLFETTTITLEVTVQALAFDEKLYRLPILDTLVEVFEQWLLCLVWTRGVTEIIEEE